MKKILIIIFGLSVFIANCKKDKDDKSVLFGAAILASQQQVATALPDATHKVTAKIREKASGSLLQNVTITFSQQTTKQLRVTTVSTKVTTDANGQFDFYMAGYVITLKVKKADGTDYLGEAIVTPSADGGFPKVTYADGTEFTLELIDFKLIDTATNTGTSTNTGTTTYTIGGSISGLTVAGLVLQNNTTDDLTVASNAATFTFTTKVSGAYSVTVKTQPTGYTCTVSSGSGTATADVNNVNVSCVINAPSALTYTGSPYTFTRTVAITTITPAITGTVTGCTSNPTLPAGLSIDSTTCAISGTPTVSSAATDYTITASNAGGSKTATINIAVSVAWAQEAYLKAPNAGASDQFGYSVSVSSDTIAVSAYLESSNQTTITNGTTASAAGAVYVFKRTGTTWTQEAYLKAPNAETGDRFGYSVSLFSDTIAVGAINEDSNQTTITNGSTASADNAASNSGAVYVFKRTGTTWSQEAYLKASNTETLDRFDYSVSVSSDTIAVGAVQEDSNQTTITNGSTASADNEASNSGAVYVFKRTGTTWAQEAYLKAPNAEAGDQFGYSVSVSTDTIAVGARSEGSNQTTITNGTTASADNSASLSGAVYVFRKQ